MRRLFKALRLRRPMGAMKLAWPVLVAIMLAAGCSDEARLPTVLVVQDKPADWADAMKLGFADGIEANGYLPGKEVAIRHKSAAGEAASLTLIAQGIRGADVDLVFTLGTQASQVVFSAVKDTPLLFGAVTDPIEANFYKGSLDAPLGNITGTQDRWPYEAQFDLIQQLLPKAKKIGVPATDEVNTKVSVALIRQAADARGLEIVEKPVLSQSEVPSGIAALLSESVDAVFIPADNTLQNASPKIIAECNAKKIPVFTGISGIVESGALATVGTNYYELGRVNGEMAARILRGEQPRSIPVSVATHGDIYINLKSARMLDVEIPPSVQGRAFKVFE